MTPLQLSYIWLAAEGFWEAPSNFVLTPSSRNVLKTLWLLHHGGEYVCIFKTADWLP